MSDGGELSGDLLITKLVNLAHLDVEFLRQGRCNHLEILVGLLFACPGNCLDPVLSEIIVQRLKECLAELVACALRSAAAAIAGYKSAGLFVLLGWGPIHCSGVLS